MIELNDKQVEWMKSQMQDDSAGSIIHPIALKRRVEVTADNEFKRHCDSCDDDCTIPDPFECKPGVVEHISDALNIDPNCGSLIPMDLDIDSGYMVKDSTLKYIIEKLVNEIIKAERTICADEDG